MSIIVSITQVYIANKEAEVAKKQLATMSKQTDLIDIQTTVAKQQLVMQENQMKHDYAIRLQLVNARYTLDPPNLPEAVFTYKATLQNKGLKPVEIIRIDFASGRFSDLRKSEISTQVVGRFLGTGEDIDLQFKISGREMLAIEQKYRINQCAIYMLIKYKDALGNERAARPILLGGYDEGNSQIIVLSSSHTIE